MAILQRSVPPRLARATERSPDLSVLRVAGAHAVAVLGAAGMPIPHNPNRALETTLGTTVVEVARTDDKASFVFQITLPSEQRGVVEQRLTSAGAHSAGTAALGKR